MRKMFYAGGIARDRHRMGTSLYGRTGRQRNYGFPPRNGEFFAPRITRLDRTPRWPASGVGCHALGRPAKPQRDPQAAESSFSARQSACATRRGRSGQRAAPLQNNFRADSGRLPPAFGRASGNPFGLMMLYPSRANAIRRWLDRSGA